MFITIGAMAQTVVTSINTEKYYTLKCKATDHGPYIGVTDAGEINGRSTAPAYVTFEAAEGGYYIKVGRKYLNNSTNGSALSVSETATTVWTLNVPTHTQNVVTFGCGSDFYLNNNHKTGTPYLKSNYHNGGPGTGHACSLWEMAEYDAKTVNTPEMFINGKVYTFVTKRGSMGASTESDIAISTAKTTADTNTDYFKWTVYRSKGGKYYIYNIGKAMFLGEQSTDNNVDVPMSATPAAVTFRNTELDGYPIMFRTTDSGNCVVNHSKEHSHGLITWNAGWEDLDDEGSSHVITEVDELDAEILGTIATVVDDFETDNTEVLAQLNTLLAFENCIGTKVGEYVVNYDGYEEKIAEVKEFVNNVVSTKIPTVAEVEAQIDVVQGIIATAVPNLPVNGKAYTFKNVLPGDNVCWFTYTAEGKIELTTDESSATVFICRELEGGKFAFALNAGKYLIWRGSNAGYNGNSGVADAYDNTEVAYADFTIEKMTTAANYDAGVDMTATRYMLVKGRRNGTGDNQFNYYVIKWNNGTPVFDQANAPFYKLNHNSAGPFSSAFIMDEVEYANAPELKAIEGELVTIENAEAIATFSAPFPTVVPQGVTAYYAVANEGTHVTLEAIATGEAIPANEGVILVGDAGTATMAPAATETIATISDNLLGNSAGAAKELTGGYILAKGGNGVGFYACSGGTLAMNKSYLDITADQAAVEIRLPGTTGVENVVVENEVKAIYDLTGRRVEAITAPGIYVVNGRKVLVK